jgi:hypothetical protein
MACQSQIELVKDVVVTLKAGGRRAVYARQLF